ncbi:unnamed protein product [Hymenolepis diminuta]|uniref:ShKT domain-containing protein n=1 Tax=Hymenolepis diminuta TaxID=6216 RepID=A0A564XYQ1_HYMDI|nr:unnamed protein product [Hymenolepis diminuta]
MNGHIHPFVIFCLLLPSFSSNSLDLDLFDNSEVEISDALHAPMNMDFPVYRLYHPDTKTYISKSNNSNEILATERFLFSRLIEWEWIPLERNIGIYLRNKADKSYLCFDKYGKPIAREVIDQRQCMLRGFTPVTDDNGIESSTVTNSESGVGYLREMTDYVNVKPQAIYLVSKFYSPPWIIGFCPNGNSYANDDPLLPRCHSDDLSTNWGVFYLCPVLPESCRKDMCFNSNHLFEKYFTGCPHRCTYSIQCGGLLTKRRNIVEFD